jgi:AcrR family transcriptional regulator
MSPILLRRSQAERRDATRKKLCVAALDELVAVGVERASLPSICKRANVSRGAQVHHYPTREDLMAGAFEQLMEEWRSATHAFLPTLRGNPDWAERLVRFIWREIFTHPQMLAALYLMMSARHDAGLRARIEPLTESWYREIDQTWKEQFDHGEPSRLRFAQILDLNLCVLRGLALNASFRGPKWQPAEALEIWIGMLCAEVRRIGNDDDFPLREDPPGSSPVLLNPPPIFEKK